MRGITLPQILFGVLTSMLVAIGFSIAIFEQYMAENKIALMLLFIMLPVAGFLVGYARPEMSKKYLELREQLHEASGQLDHRLTTLGFKPLYFASQVERVDFNAKDWEVTLERSKSIGFITH